MNRQVHHLRTDRDRYNAIEAIKRAPLGGKFRLVIEPHKQKRRLAQNNLLHMWMSELSQKYAETHGEWHKPDVWKLYVKQMFLGEYSYEVMGKVVTEIRHTSDLSVAEFSEFLNTVEMYVADEFGVLLTRPSDIYFEAMGATRRAA